MKNMMCACIINYLYVFDGNNQLVFGLFHHLSSKDATKFRQALLTKILIWQEEARITGLSCGTFVEAGGGKGSGKGVLFLTPIPLEPFLGH